MNRNNENRGNVHAKEEAGKKTVIEDADIEVNDVDDADNNTAEETENTEISDLDALKNLLTQKEEEVAKEKKEYLFLMAEFDNFRKRTMRERADLIKSASEKALQGLLPIIDDFERGLDAIKDSTDAEAVKEGMRLIYNKFVKYLNDNGVKEIPSTGQPFDTEVHEAVAMIPAESEDQKGIVKDTVQKGYMLNDKVLRHAKVVVSQ